jgi:predicted phosphodiesterase
MTTSPKTPRLDLNPSAAARWVTCTASPRFILANADKLPLDDTVYNLEGTTAHEIAAALLQDRKPDPKECPTPITKEMHKHAWNYMEYVQALGGKPIVEKKYPLWYMPGRNGKVDVLTVFEGHTHIVDYKFGQGVIVDPFQNLQGAIYARSAMVEVLNSGQIDKGKLVESPVSIHIYQPRGRNAEDSPSHVWETTWGEILEFTKQVTDAAELILADGETEFKPSDKACRFCPAKGFCVARTGDFVREVKVLPEVKTGPLTLPPATVVSVEQLAAVLKHGEAIKQWVDDAKDYALEYMKNGGSIEGFKLVLGRQGNRYWTDEEKAAKLLLEHTHLRETEVYERSVVSPGGAEKLLGKNKLTLELANLIARSEGKPTIAPEDDKRPAFGGIDPKLEFEGI